MQHPRQSAIEIVTGTAAGLALAWLAGQFWLYPWYGIEVDPVKNFKVTLWFTVVSFARGYIWRRLFSRWE
jgi:uncharacterized membrane protein YccC